MRSALGYWIDSDVYILNPIDFGGDPVFGLEDHRKINGAVLHLPSESRLLSRILSFIYQRPIIPPWWSFCRKSYQRCMYILGADKTADQLPWGSLGPTLLTYFIKSEGYCDKVLPKDVFYPLHYTKSTDVLDPNIDIEAMCTDKTVAVHLWNKSLRPFKDMPPPANSFLIRCA